jgi:beta-lactamase regulating signal transducer with metallopeptidase domain
MSVLIGIALKSLLIAGLTLGLLALMRHRSAAERSWVAHIGLFALVVMAVAPVVLPTWSVEAPALFAPAQTAQAPATTVAASHDAASLPAVATATPASIKPAASRPAISPALAASAIYAVPAAILLLITFFALARLIALQARADVLVDSHWLSALARAQRRMGFKHGTALLTSNELASPISWGVVRPVILLNTRAVEASGEAEAIIAHELAHVARMDWAKLLLARIATALFWFNPFVWMLAREAHQLREETADDAVRSQQQAGAFMTRDPDEQLGIIGVGDVSFEHGVAPSKSSLARRVARVLDGKLVRGPAARSFALGVFAGAMLVAAPLAALTITPAGTAKQVARAAASDGQYPAPYYSPAPQIATDLPGIISQGVATSVESAVAAIRPETDTGDFRMVAPSSASLTRSNGVVVARAPSGAMLTVYPAGRDGRRKVVAVAPNGATTVTYADADDDVFGAVSAPFHTRDRAIENAIAMKAVGVTPDYVAAIRASAPQLRDADLDDVVGMKAVGVTPEYIRDIVSTGVRNFDAGDLSGARAVGVDGTYIRAMRAAGMSDADLSDLTGARAVGVDANYVREMRGAGMGDADLDDLTGARAVGVTAEYIRQMRLQGYDGDLSDFTALKSLSKDKTKLRLPRPPRLSHVPPPPPPPPPPTG